MMSNWVQAVPQDYFGGTMISSLGYKKARMPSTSWGQVDQELWLIYVNNMVLPSN